MDGELRAPADRLLALPALRPLINANKNLRLIGPLPAEFQSYLVYAAAPMSGAASPQTARAFIAFLASPAAKAFFAANGVE